MVTANRLLETYQFEIEDLDEPEDLCSQALIVLSTRDSLAQLPLTEQEQQALSRLDAELIKRWETLAECLPFPSEHDRKHWWWFLDEGPQVREEALQTA